MTEYTPHDGFLPRLGPENWLATGSAKLQIPVGHRASGTSGSDRHFLLVTAPFGPFSRHLAAALRDEGARCSRVLLNGGDLIDWGVRDAAVYRGDADAWPSWIRAHLIGEDVTDLVTHGDSNPYATSAMREAHRLGVRVHVFEEGYLRPHWITLERDGVNAHSSLPRNPEYYVRAHSAAASRRPVEISGIGPAAVSNISLYHFLAFALGPLFARYKSPYAHSPPRQATGHVRRLAAQVLQRRRRTEALTRIIDAPGPLFLALLQRPGDSQLVRHSRFGGCDSFIDCVVDSFGAHAPANARLLIKSHPLDHGLEPHARDVAAAAARAGVADRVFFTDDGCFLSLVRRADGIVSVNSTAGLATLELGRPTLALGQAIYDLPGLTHQSGLDTFWSVPEAPDRDLFEAFRAVVAARTQVNGAFSTRRGIALAAPEAARRLLAATGET